MAQVYPVVCDCGRTHPVPGTSAGCDLTCGCGRTFAVPPLQQLRAAAGESPLSADLMIQALLLDGALPEEKDCVACELPTADTGFVDVNCERPEVQRRTTWGFNPVPLLFGWLSFTRTTAVREVGRDVRFTLPLRVCRECGGGANPRDLLRRVPLYRRLLEKYTAATVGPLRFGP